jgi:hypothetical protein
MNRILRELVPYKYRFSLQKEKVLIGHSLLGKYVQYMLLLIPNLRIITLALPLCQICLALSNVHHQW